MAELQAKGAVNFDVISDILWYHAGFKLGSDYELSASSSAGRCSSTRCARHVALPNVTLLAGCSVEETVFDAAGGRVRAAPIRHRASGEQSALRADLVVDATGRSSSTPKWLANWGFGEVAASEVRIDFSFNPILLRGQGAGRASGCRRRSFSRGASSRASPRPWRVLGRS